MNPFKSLTRLALFCALLVFCLFGPALARGGIGGTGSPRGGIGGTGITAIGTIQRFGSIFVNGIEYRLRAHTQYFVDGHRASVRALGLGDEVFVTARGPLPHPAARTVRAQHALIGRITAVHGARLAVLGVPVTLARGANTAGRFGNGSRLRPGTWVAVSGFARGRHGVLATRVRVHGAQTRLLVRGPVSAQTRRRIRILNVWFRMTGHWPMLHGTVVARGSYEHGQAVLTQIRPAHGLGRSGRGFVSILGWVTEHDGVWRYQSLRLQPSTAAAARTLRAAHGPQLVVMTGRLRGRRLLLTGFGTSPQIMPFGQTPRNATPQGARASRPPAPGHPVIPHPAGLIHPDIRVIRPAVPAQAHIP
ncbi:MAG: DUF5666 domain-containing protein [Gammaproteobacteria bacterium]|nr:DUF5666 domain-containing protein [Gammaproteobacteria bacterium]